MTNKLTASFDHMVDGLGEQWDEFYLDSMGALTMRESEIRFAIHLNSGKDSIYCEDYKPEPGRPEAIIGTRVEVLRWIAGRIIYNV